MAFREAGGSAIARGGNQPAHRLREQARQRGRAGRPHARPLPAAAVRHRGAPEPGGGHISGRAARACSFLTFLTFFARSKIPDSTTPLWTSSKRTLPQSLPPSILRIVLT